MIITLIPGVLFFSCKFSLHSDSSYLQGRRGRVARETLDSIWTAPCVLKGESGSQLVCRKPMSTLRQNGSSPTGLFIHLHALPQSQCLPFCHFISVNSPSGTWEETSKHRVHFWDVEGGKRERRSALTLSDEQRPDTAGNGYVSPFFPLCDVTH